MRHPVVVALPVLLVVACTSARRSPGTDTSAVGLTWTAHLNSMMVTGTRMVGEIRVTPGAKAGTSHLVLQVSGGAISTHHPWVIASGRCTEIIPNDLGGRAMYPPLDLSTDGTGRVTTDLPITIPIDQPYHIALFASAMERDLMVSCGELAIVPTKRPVR